MVKLIKVWKSPFENYSTALNWTELVCKYANVFDVQELHNNRDSQSNMTERCETLLFNICVTNGHNQKNFKWRFMYPILVQFNHFL